jgi:hypothetical protein
LPRYWLPFNVFGLISRFVALVAAIVIIIVFGNDSEAPGIFALVLGTGLLIGAVLSILIGIRRRRALSQL